MAAQAKKQKLLESRKAKISSAAAASERANKGSDARSNYLKMVQELGKYDSNVDGTGGKWLVR